MLNINYEIHYPGTIAINIAADDEEIVLNDKSFLAKISEIIEQSIREQKYSINFVFNLSFINCHLSTDPIRKDMSTADLLAPFIAHGLTNVGINIKYALKGCIGERVIIYDAAALSVANSTIKELSLVNTYNVTLSNSDIGMVTDFPLDRDSDNHKSKYCSTPIYLQINKQKRRVDTANDTGIHSLSLDFVSDLLFKDCGSCIVSKRVYTVGLGGNEFGIVSITCHDSKVVTFSKAFSCAAIYEGKQYILTDKLHFSVNNFYNSLRSYKPTGFGNYLMKLNWMDNYYPAVLSDVNHSTLEFGLYKSTDLLRELEKIKKIYEF